MAEPNSGKIEFYQRCRVCGWSYPSNMMHSCGGRPIHQPPSTCLQCDVNAPLIITLKAKADRLEKQLARMRLQWEIYTPVNAWPNSEGGKCPLCNFTCSLSIDKDGMRSIECNDCTFSCLAEDFEALAEIEKQEK